MKLQFLSKETIYQRSDKEESDVLVKKDLKHILVKLNKIDRTTGMIQAIYGSQVVPLLIFFCLITRFIYHMYGVSVVMMCNSSCQESIAKFKESGIALLEQIQNSLESLEKSSEALPELAEAELPNDLKIKLQT